MKLKTPLRLKIETKYKYDYWYEALHQILRNEDPDYTDTYRDFTDPKKPARLTNQEEEATIQTGSIETSNKFSILDSDKITNEEQNCPPTFKERTPPLYIKFLTNDKTILDTLKKTIQKETTLELKGDSIKVQPCSRQDYATILKTASEGNWQFFTHNPMIDKISKYVLKGLPNDSELKNIQDELKSKGIDTIQIRQMTKTYTDENNTHTHAPQTHTHHKHTRANTQTHTRADRHTHTDRQTDTHTDRQTDTYAHRDRLTHRYTHRQTHTDTHTDTHTHRQTETDRDRQTG